MILSLHKQVQYIALPDFFFDNFYFIFLLTIYIESSLQDIAIEKVLQRDHRLEEAEETRRIEANGSDDLSRWHNFMRWTDTFHGKDLEVRKKKKTIEKFIC
jgi:hypothetical protein